VDPTRLESAKESRQSDGLGKRLPPKHTDAVTRGSDRVQQRLNQCVRRQRDATLDRMGLRDVASEAALQRAALYLEYAPSARSLDN